MQVLQQGAWDVDKIKFDKILLPRQLLNCLTDFSNFYVARHKTHKLIWVYGLVTILYSNNVREMLK